MRRQLAWGSPLYETFPDLYSFAVTKGALAAVLWVEQGGFGAWDPKFERHFNDWEMEAVQAFIGLINDRYIRPQSKDTLIWKGNASGGFTVMAYFNILEGA